MKETIKPMVFKHLLNSEIGKTKPTIEKTFKRGLIINQPEREGK